MKCGDNLPPLKTIILNYDLNRKEKAPSTNEIGTNNKQLIHIEPDPRNGSAYFAICMHNEKGMPTCSLVFEDMNNPFCALGSFKIKKRSKKRKCFDWYLLVKLVPVKKGDFLMETKNFKFSKFKRGHTFDVVIKRSKDMPSLSQEGLEKLSGGRVCIGTFV